MTSLNTPITTQLDLLGQLKHWLGKLQRLADSNWQINEPFEHDFLAQIGTLWKLDV